jgi:hypothetical protein
MLLLCDSSMACSSGKPARSAVLNWLVKARISLLVIRPAPKCLSDEEKLAMINGRLKFEQGSIAIHIFNRSFFEKISKKGIELPYHLAHKSVAYVKNDGTKCKPRIKNGYKPARKQD